MNEELMKVLLETLQQMKSGAPEAFNELVRQRATYCEAMVWMGAIGGLFTCTVSVLMAIAGIKIEAKDRYSNWVPALVIPAALLGIAGVSLFFVGLTTIPDAIAPLGKILGGLSK